MYGLDVKFQKPSPSNYFSSSVRWCWLEDWHCAVPAHLHMFASGFSDAGTRVPGSPSTTLSLSPWQILQMEAMAMLKRETTYPCESCIGLSKFVLLRNYFMCSRVFEMTIQGRLLLARRYGNDC